MAVVLNVCKVLVVYRPVVEQASTPRALAMVLRSTDLFT